MIGRRGKVLIFLYVAFLAILFLMCSTDLIIREPERESYQIAVIIEDVRGDNYSNFRKGMDQAAVEFNIDVHFITLYEKADAEQQMELMDREQQDGADALVVVPADEERVTEKYVNVPVIFLRSCAPEEAGADSIVTDYEKMGGMLAHEILRNHVSENSVLLLTNPEQQSTMDRLFLKGARTVFSDEGYRIQEVRQEKENDIRSALEALKAQTGESVALLAENQDLLAQAAGILADDPEIANCVEGLYGRGNTMSILNYLDHGEITGICVTDDFGTGYLSVRAAIQALEDTKHSITVMDSYYIEKEDLRKADWEKLLFPIE